MMDAFPPAVRKVPFSMQGGIARITSNQPLFHIEGMRAFVEKRSVRFKG